MQQITLLDTYTANRRPLKGRRTCSALFNGYWKSRSSVQTWYGKKLQITGYFNSDWVQKPPERRSITGYVLMSAGGAVSWKSQKQNIVTQSSLGTEYTAVLFVIQEKLWPQKF